MQKEDVGSIRMIKKYIAGKSVGMWLRETQ
jgi:hypothetical protein